MTEAEKMCCEPFDPAPWDEQTHVWDNKKFVKDHVKCFMHIPIDMAKKMIHNMEIINKAKAKPEKFLMLTDGSAMGMDIYIHVTADVPDAEMVTISGTFLTKVFEGSFTQLGKWKKEMHKYVEDQDKKAQKIYTFFTTCPKCAEKYGKNYVVLLAKID